jgi:hypothetical protein
VAYVDGMVAEEADIAHGKGKVGKGWERVGNLVLKNWW